MQLHLWVTLKVAGIQTQQGWSSLVTQNADPLLEFCVVFKFFVRSPYESNPVASLSHMRLRGEWSFDEAFGW